MDTRNYNSSRISLFALTGSAIIIVIFCAITYSIAKQLFVFIAPDERALIISPNSSIEVLEPGYHFIFPNRQVVVYNISHQIYTTQITPNGETDSLNGTTKDGKSIQIEISVTYAIDPEQVSNLHQKWGDSHLTSMVVRPLIRSNTRSILEKFTYNEIKDDPEEVEKNISEELEYLLSENFLVLVKFELHNVSIAP